MDSATDPDIPEVHRVLGGGALTRTSHHSSYPFIDPSQFNLEGRVALITGASYGIGQTIAVSYTQARISGLVLAARSDLTETVSAIQKAAEKASVPAPKVLVLKVDVTDETSVADAAEAVKKEWPEGIDIVVSNAGMHMQPPLQIPQSTNIRPKAGSSPNSPSQTPHQTTGGQVSPSTSKAPT